MSPHRSPWRIASIVLFTILLGVVLHTFGDYGMSWDEYYRQTEGAKKLVYYQNLFSGHWAPYDNPEDLYPGFYDILHQSVNLLQPCGPGTLGLIYTDHLLTALFGVLALLGAWKIGYLLGRDRIAFLSAFFLALFPHFYGHSFINPKDIPFAAAFVWSLYYILQLINRPLGWKLLLKLGVAIGVTLGIRVGGALLVILMAGAMVLRLWFMRGEQKLLPHALKLLGFSVLVGLLAFLILIPSWPFCHPNPIGTLFTTLTKITNYPWSGTVIFNGEIYCATDLPWYYLPEMLAITTPEFLVVFLLAGAALMVVRIAQGLKREASNYLTANRLQRFFVVFAFIFPMAIAILKHTTLYDGIRHFLFVLPLWAILAAITFDWVWHYFKRHAHHSRSVVVKAAPVALLGVLALAAADSVLQYVQLHPYQYTYYNHFVGGLEKAWQSFDTEYWGTSHREAVNRLAAKLAKEGDHKVYKVTSPLAPWLVENFLPSNMVYTTDARQAHFFISFLRFNAHLCSNGPIIPECIVGREGAPLAVVRDCRKLIAQKEQASKKKRPAAPLVSGILDLIQVP